MDTRTLQRRTLAVLGDAPPYGPLQPTFISNYTLVVTGRDGLVERVDLRTGRITDRLRGHQVDVFAPVVSRDGRVLVAGAGDGLLVWDLRTLRPLGGPTSLWTPGSYAIDPRASRLAATIGSGSTIDLLDRSTRRRLARLTVDGSDIEASAFSPDGQLLAAGSQDGRVQIFSVPRRTATAPAFDALAGAIESVAFSPDGKTLVTTGENGQIRLWDVQTREPLGAPSAGAGGRRRHRRIHARRPVGPRGLLQRVRRSLGREPGVLGAPGLRDRRPPPHPLRMAAAPPGPAVRAGLLRRELRSGP